MGVGVRYWRIRLNARQLGQRQLYCTVAEENDAYKFFLRNGFIKAGNSPSHYKEESQVDAVPPPSRAMKTMMAHVSVVPGN